MNDLPVIAIFDIGKTNKKLFLFDEQYRIVFQKSVCLDETTDEDGFPCENLESLLLFIVNSLEEIFRLDKFKIRFVNFSAYGASLVYVNEFGRPIAPLYSYLKPYPSDLNMRFYSTYDSKEEFSIQTASPALGSLNSGLQLYRLKYEKPVLLKNTHFALHLPQYLSSVLTGKYYSELTSIGCHTALWDFAKNAYHSWLYKENLHTFLAPIENAGETFFSAQSQYPCGVGTGLHDSSAALIPYLINFSMPFILISTGTWCISMNPFNKMPLTVDELRSDCLCYLQYGGEPVKASRLHAGLEYEQQVKRIAVHFNQDISKYKNIEFTPELVYRLKSDSAADMKLSHGFTFRKKSLGYFTTDIEAYYQLISDLADQQFLSTSLVVGNCGVEKIFVDGAFSNNSIFMHLLANRFQGLEVFAASLPQATALGAALSVHAGWNSRLIRKDMIGLRHYPAGHSSTK